MNAQRFNDPRLLGVDPLPAAVATPLHPAPLPLAPVGPTAVALDGDGGRWSSDAGVVLRPDIADPLGFPRALAAVLADRREARRRHVPLEAWRTQRVWHMAAGYAEANDATPRRDAPLGTLRRERLPATGAPLQGEVF